MYKVGCIRLLVFVAVTTLFIGGARAQQDVQQTVVQLLENKPKRHLFDGIAVGVDLAGTAMHVLGSDWMQVEAFARLNLYDKYFPIVELGYGQADHEGSELDNRCEIKAPYFRIGADYNFIKKHEGNRLFGGLRYGFSTYEYDLDSPLPLADPVWKTEQPFVQHGLSGNTHWAEGVFGLETRLWRFISVGWDLRLKLRVSQKNSEIGKPWYVPGMGLNDSSLNFGGSFKVVFDLTRK